MKASDLKKQISALRDKLDAIEYNEAAEKYAGLYRKCFKYRNCYSCPENPKDYWFLYSRVISVDGNRVTTCSFQRDKYGNCRYDPKELRFGHSMAGHEEISEKEFMKQFDKFLKYLVCP